MKKTITLLAMLICFAAGVAYAEYSVSDIGTWPKSWPREMEALRKQSRTLTGSMVDNLSYAIRFNNRKQFETSWKHILKVKTKGAPIFLVRAPNFFLGDKAKAGIVVHCPPIGQASNPATPEAPISGVTEIRMRWMNAKYIELVVDDDIVDLKRIHLPSNSPIVDERFKDKKTNRSTLQVQVGGIISGFLRHRL